MKEFRIIADQGEITVKRTELKRLPQGAKPASDSIAGHSESGHHHVVVGNAQLFHTDDPLVSYVVAKGSWELEHLRTDRQHETLRALADESEGEVIWQIGRQREDSPSGWRMVMD